MQVKDHYDLIVIGDQLSGLFLAAGAAQAGLHVLVLEGTSVPTVLYEVPSGRLLGDVMAEPVIGLKSESKVDNFFRSLGLYQEIADLFPLYEPALQVINPGRRMEFCFDQKAMEEEVRREFPEFSAQEREKFCRTLLGLTVNKRNFSDVIADIPLPVQYENFSKLITLFGALDPDRLTYPAYKSVMDLASQGIRYVRGGTSALRERLLSRILVFGGTVKRVARVEEIVFERGRLAGVLLSSFEGFVRSPVVVGAMEPSALFNLLPAKMRNKKLQESIAMIRPKYWRLSFTVLVDERVIPEGLGSHAVIYDPQRSLEGDNYIHVQVFHKEMYGGIPADRKAIVCRLLLPIDEFSRKDVERALKRSLNRLEEVMPFLRETPYFVSPDPEKLEQDFVFQKYYSVANAKEISPAFIVYESAMHEDARHDNLMEWSNYGLSGLGLCSRDIRPLLGLTGEVFTAMELLATLDKRGKESRA